MKILITGDQGFVGRNFHRLIGHEHEIVGVDLKTNGDCRDFYKQSSERFDLVIHLAAIVGGRMTIEGNPLSVADDLSIDAETFQWAIRTKQPRLVYFSSSAAYPVEYQQKWDHFKLAEYHINLDRIKNPDLTYGWAKLTGEYLAKFANAYGVKTFVFRPFSGYGNDQDLEYPFPSFIRRALDKDDPFSIWGDGTQVRDFIHIDDIVNAVMMAVEQDYTDPLNLGTGQPTSFNDLAEMVMRISGHKVPVQHLPTKPVGVHYRVANVKNMRQVYTPKIALDEGIYRALYTW